MLSAAHGRPGGVHAHVHVHALHSQPPPNAPFVLLAPIKGVKDNVNPCAKGLFLGGPLRVLPTAQGTGQ